MQNGLAYFNNKTTNIFTASKLPHGLPLKLNPKYVAAFHEN